MSLQPFSLTLYLSVYGKIADLFKIKIHDRNNRKELLEKALKDGLIIYNTEHILNIFSIKVENQPRVIENRQKLYPELSNELEAWKFACIDQDNKAIYNKSNIFTIPRGREMLCIFLGISGTSTPDVLKFVSLTVKISFQAGQKMFDLSFMERLVMFLLSHGLSEVMIITGNFIASNKDDKYVQMIRQDDGIDILAGIVLSGKYELLKIDWK